MEGVDSVPKSSYSASLLAVSINSEHHARCRIRCPQTPLTYVVLETWIRMPQLSQANPSDQVGAGLKARKPNERSEYPALEGHLVSGAQKNSS